MHKKSFVLVFTLKPMLYGHKSRRIASFAILQMARMYFARLFTLIFCLCVMLSGVSCSSRSERYTFDQFTQNLFLNEVQTDTLSLNYALAHPENYGLTDLDTTLGGYGIEYMKEDLVDTENYLGSLRVYDYNKLTSDQKLTYQILKEYLEESLQFGNYMYYSECLGPTTGLQAQLPILLAEYSFYDKEDIENYLKLLICVKDYFKDIIAYEKEKSAAGLFMSDRVASRIIEQCEAFISNPEDNFLITYFDEKIVGFEGLTAKEIVNYEKVNKEAVLTYVIPAYRQLIDALQELMGTGTNEAGLYYYPQGKEYYANLAKYKTGSDKSMEEMNQMLERSMEDGMTHLTNLVQDDSSLVDKYLSFSSFPLTDPNDILTDLKADITKDFPAAVPVSCEIKYVPESLSDYLSPAMYLVPPIDNYDNNNIYINGHSKQTLSMIYTTVAHEGYPGHLYQCVYFRSKNPAPIRNLLNFTGYDEGWATYVEYYSYHLAGIDENLADFLETNNSVLLSMYARADIGIHYEGWKRKEATEFMLEYVGEEQIASAIYDTLLEEPGIYLPYAIGYLEIEELKAKAEQELGSDFQAKDFHKFLLDIGPAQFDIINEYMDTWVKNEQE